MPNPEAREGGGQVGQRRPHARPREIALVPAPISTPSSTNTTPRSAGTAPPARARPAAARSPADRRRTGRAAAAWPRRTSNPSTTPDQTPHTTIRRVASRVAATSPAPSVRPVMACPAMAIASRAKASRVQTWWRSRTRPAGPRPSGWRRTVADEQHDAAGTTVRMSSAKPAVPAGLMPARSGRERGASRGAARPPRRGRRRRRASGPARVPQAEPGDAPAQAEDEPRVQHRVEREGAHRDDQRRDRCPAGRAAPRSPPARPAWPGAPSRLIRRYVMACRPSSGAAPNRSDDRAGASGQHDRDERGADRQRQPDAVHALRGSPLGVLPAPICRATDAVVP